ncbi:gamma-glutamyl-gamma-aminobutyraldehyde dehydrogenase/4-guanidinobutyraldehyde dehydrogenase/NAD-dependent aldehyde dehydrogenase [Thermocatellispora tengchongensis]|uniref:Gamma-glutamyl-gamma-aminobutyraldehyde dehydrogenase/4-guanidinobutyraldehyde dehydrogenase/NAD-dependent aldehyde dehydrogenase n=1 Tax=Thermocatellispora tengchongensis TaxID=1073253 RepID=A0A840NT43_9ACTN|nr:aldehyde dehydrogenase [Thermocatellispora tengchongensis]MBB5131874.1 gamma-glutamyl-gamma-aminobutyraldehyde dehydrogenase/4-guanidinobutyraldehyde dehydrogenase/NAD-dependent aldehyde dehydrogenase [Thermocatellispora tengchongensis]
MTTAVIDADARREELERRFAALTPPSLLHIGGEQVEAASGARFACVSPRDGRVVAHVAEGDAADIDRAVAAARRAFESGVWSGLHPRERRAVLQRLARLVERHAEELALLESVDMGKPFTDALAVDLRVTVQCLDFYAEAADKMYDEVAPTGPDVLATVTREPLGVVGAVVPWNFPLMMAAWKLAPALAAGNAVVLKPAEQSPLSALRLAELAVEAGVPAGILNVVPGHGPTAGAALGRHPGVDAITFTGSGEVGRLFMRYSAESNLKQVSLELGGKSPQIVMPDAPDLAAVARSVATGIFFNQGEVCSAGSRLLVHRSVREELLALVLEETRRTVVGDPLDPRTRVGALVEEEHLRRVLGHVRGALEDGASLLTGGERTLTETGGCYMTPTVFDRVDPGMRIARQEVFGPVLSVIDFDDPEEAVRIANGTEYGLAAAVWTRDLSTAHRMSRAVRAGTVWVNCFDDSDITVPFGGYAQSGFGRDKSLHALDKYTQFKTTWIKL